MDVPTRYRHQCSGAVDQIHCISGTMSAVTLSLEISVTYQLLFMLSADMPSSFDTSALSYASSSVVSAQFSHSPSADQDIITSSSSGFLNVFSFAAVSRPHSRSSDALFLSPLHSTSSSPSCSIRSGLRVPRLSGDLERDLARPFCAGARPPLAFGGGRTKTKSTVTVWSRSFVPFAPSIAARASSRVGYSMSAYPYSLLVST